MVALGAFPEATALVSGCTRSVCGHQAARHEAYYAARIFRVDPTCTHCLVSPAIGINPGRDRKKANS